MAASRTRASCPPISDYAIIGDCRAAALIDREGSLDWLCAPRFDSPSIFGALLDPQRGGRFRIATVDHTSTSRKYVEGTNVLETSFTTPTGRLMLIDFMPAAAEEDKRRRLLPDHELLRTVECTEGTVQVSVCCEPRPDYGRRPLRLAHRGALGCFGEVDGRVVAIRLDAPLQCTADGSRLEGVFPLRAGERRYFSVSMDAAHPAILPVLGASVDARLAEAVAWWRGWSATCTYEGPYREFVLRSALVLKLMTYAPSGALIAAPTTSLPEWPGGARNWDYRYCWLRDASLTLRALFGLGYLDEGHAFVSWLLSATRLTWPELQILYDVYGERLVRERELPYLSGYADSRPVRVGNAAADQLQLDVYGEVVDAAYRFIRLGGHLDRATSRMLVGLGETVCRRWQEPDEGIWEIRSGRRHHTLSKAMCWVALDRLLGLHEQNHLRAPAPRFRKVRNTIRAEVEQHGYNRALGSYVATLGGDEIDASLLLLGLYRYVDPADPRMMSTCRRIHQRLERRGLIYRYLDTDDGLTKGEGAFGIAGFWGVECRALGGDLDGARRAFEQLCGYANDVGLLSEEYNPDSGEALGNFPQAFSHVGLINAASTLAACARGQHPEADVEARQPMAEERV